MSRLRISAISIALICANQAPWAQNSQIETWTPPSPGQERHPGGQYRWSPKGNQQTSNASGQTQSPSAITDGSGGTGADAPVQVQFSGAGKQGGVDAQLTGPGVIRMWASTPSPTFGFWSGGGQEEASYGSRGAASSVEGGAGGQGFP